MDEDGACSSMQVPERQKVPAEQRSVGRAHYSSPGVKPGSMRGHRCRQSGCYRLSLNVNPPYKRGVASSEMMTYATN